MMPPDLMMVGGSAVHTSSGFIDGSFGLNVGQIYPVLICLLGVK